MPYIVICPRNPDLVFLFDFTDTNGHYLAHLKETAEEWVTGGHWRVDGCKVEGHKVLPAMDPYEMRG